MNSTTDADGGTRLSFPRIAHPVHASALSPSSPKRTEPQKVPKFFRFHPWNHVARIRRCTNSPRRCTNSVRYRVPRQRCRGILSGHSPDDRGRFGRMALGRRCRAPFARTSVPAAAFRRLTQEAGTHARHRNNSRGIGVAFDPSWRHDMRARNVMAAVAAVSTLFIISAAQAQF